MIGPQQFLYVLHALYETARIWSFYTLNNDSHSTSREFSASKIRFPAQRQNGKKKIKNIPRTREAPGMPLSMRIHQIDKVSGL